MVFGFKTHFKTLLGYKAQAAAAAAEDSFAAAAVDAKPDMSDILEDEKEHDGDYKKEADEPEAGAKTKE